MGLVETASIAPVRAIEPELDELLNDPIIQMLMQKDGVEQEELLPLLRCAMRTHDA